ncbi:DUF983 domain-containing protein [Novosphingobium mangrovi (ex Huang et al. 2023)]|uniref:DUF983 domain-containing protein n=1 Tax=Novosphingobium mangrovi (ex Huang et al. 2023) TaxID=2976432 RepID=A0ABT2I0F8_9SPHN|nr:DUF983 domain-containing protein [Novosphingobium mangrovi (ex Huang et al. 2023)]MCT2398286.1 DUF983 domain-containing protein [Novosphingobium mangrovi (ex Huang et al. 2023)]
MSSEHDPNSKGQPDTASAALFGLCPRCGGKTLFGGAIQFAPRCRACGLDYTQFNVGDGPAAFLTLIVGAVIAILAIWVQLSFEPPFWVHAVLWIPLTTAMVIGGLRIAKAWLLGAEYRRRAGEGRLKDE